jgi:hypothetical protein
VFQDWRVAPLLQEQLLPSLFSDSHQRFQPILLNRLVVWVWRPGLCAYASSLFASARRHSRLHSLVQIYRVHLLLKTLLMRLHVLFSLVEDGILKHIEVDHIFFMILCKKVW